MINPILSVQFRLDEYMHEIQNKKKLLQTEINRIQSELNSLKMQIPNEPLGCTDPKALQQKVISPTLSHIRVNIISKAFNTQLPTGD